MKGEKCCSEILKVCCPCTLIGLLKLSSTYSERAQLSCSRRDKRQLLHKRKNKPDPSSDLDRSTVWLQPMCLALLALHCTVCHSSWCSLTSSTVKTSGKEPRMPEKRQAWKLCGNERALTVHSPVRVADWRPNNGSLEYLWTQIVI